MANRHAHKKLRAEIRARMRKTGETYQQARTRVLSPRRPARVPRTALVPCAYFGLPGTLATIEMHGVTVSMLLPSAKLWGQGYPHPFPLSMLRSALVTRGVQ